MLIPLTTASAADADAIRAQAEAAFERIRSDGTLNETTRTQRFAQAWVEAADLMQLAQATAGASIEDERIALLKRAFGIDDIAGASGPARAEVSISYRDASDRVERLETADEAIALAQRAEEQGDELLVRAIARKAYDRLTDPVWADQEWSPILDRYGASHPRAAAAIAGLQQGALVRKPTATDMFYWVVPLPPELAALGDWRVRALAEQAG